MSDTMQLAVCLFIVYIYNWSAGFIIVYCTVYVIVVLIVLQKTAI